MGCSSSRTDISKELDESFVIPFEKSLGYKLIESKAFDGILHRHSANRILTIKSFIKVFERSKLEERKFEDFYMNFIIEKPNTTPFEKYYSTKMLVNLGILLGLGNGRTKSDVLFKNYDPKAKKRIGPKKVKILIDDILHIAIELIPKYSLISLKNNTEAKIYCSYVLAGKESLEKEYFNKIIGRNSKVLSSDFIKLFSDEVMKEFLDTSDLRVKAYKIGKKISNGDKNLQKILNSPDSFNELYEINQERSSRLHEPEISKETTESDYKKRPNKYGIQILAEFIKKNRLIEKKRTEELNESSFEVENFSKTLTNENMEHEFNPNLSRTSLKAKPNLLRKKRSFITS
jgi:hypothetical protein